MIKNTKSIITELVAKPECLSLILGQTLKTIYNIYVTCGMWYKHLLCLYCQWNNKGGCITACIKTAVTPSRPLQQTELKPCLRPDNDLQCISNLQTLRAQKVFLKLTVDCF